MSPPKNQRKHTVFIARRIRRSPKARLPLRVRFSGLAAFSTEPNVRSCPSRRCLTCHAGLAFFLEGLVCAEKSQGKSGKKPTIFRPDLAAMPGSSFQKDNKRARPAERVTQQFGHIWPLCTDKHDLQPTLLGSDLAKFEHFRSTWILAKRF